jgi:hypothetical protein
MKIAIHWPEKLKLAEVPWRSRQVAETRIDIDSHNGIKAYP